MPRRFPAGRGATEEWSLCRHPHPARIALRRRCHLRHHCNAEGCAIAARRLKAELAELVDGPPLFVPGQFATESVVGWWIRHREHPVQRKEGSCTLCHHGRRSETPGNDPDSAFPPSEISAKCLCPPFVDLNPVAKAEPGHPLLEKRRSSKRRFHQHHPRAPKRCGDDETRDAGATTEIDDQGWGGFAVVRLEP